MGPYRKSRMKWSRIGSMRLYRLAMAILLLLLGASTSQATPMTFTSTTTISEVIGGPNFSVPFDGGVPFTVSVHRPFSSIDALSFLFSTTDPA